MKKVFESAFQEEALVVKSLLASAGIEAALLSEAMLDVTPLFGSGVTGQRLWVKDEEAEDAASVVADYKARREARP